MHKIKSSKLALLAIACSPLLSLGLSGWSLNTWLDNASGMSVETYQRGPDYQRWVGPGSNGRGHGVYFEPRQQTLGTSQDVPRTGSGYNEWIGGNGNGVYFTPTPVIDAGDFTRDQYSYTLALGKGMTEDGRFNYAPSTTEFFGTPVRDGFYEYRFKGDIDQDVKIRYRVVDGRVVRSDFHFNKPQY